MDVEASFEMMRSNSVQMSDYHKQQYETIRQSSFYTKIPVALISIYNAFSALGLRSFMPPFSLSVSDTIAAGVVSIFLVKEILAPSQNQAEQHLVKHEKFKQIASDICHLLAVDTSKRSLDQTALENTFMVYEALASECKVIVCHQLKHPQVSKTKDMKTCLEDHWNILHKPELYRLKKKYERCLQMDEENQLKTSDKDSDKSDAMKYYINPFYNPFSYELYTKTLGPAPIEPAKETLITDSEKVDESEVLQTELI